MRRSMWVLAALLALPAAAGAQVRGLDIYFVDTEGGAATLIVTPAGESVLIDNGNPGKRDAERIKRAADAAGLKQIDNQVITHWHLDHYGGTGELAKLIPIKHFWDRGILAEKDSDDQGNYPRLIAAYKAAGGDKSTTLHPGDLLTLTRAEGSMPISMRCLCASSKFLPDAANAPKNKLAVEFVPRDRDPSDNAKSCGFLLTYGSWRFLDLGDLTWNMEEKLVDPTDKIGKIDVYQTTHHGLEISNDPVLIKTVEPRVAIFNNGPHKGGHPDVTRTLRAIPGIKAIWQMHRNLDCPADMNTNPALIANMDDPCQGQFIHLSVAPNGRTYTVQIGPDGPKRSYETRVR